MDNQPIANITSLEYCSKPYGIWEIGATISKNANNNFKDCAFDTIKKATQVIQTKQWECGYPPIIDDCKFGSIELIKKDEDYSFIYTISDYGDFHFRAKMNATGELDPEYKVAANYITHGIQNCFIEDNPKNPFHLNDFCVYNLTTPALDLQDNNCPIIDYNSFFKSEIYTTVTLLGATTLLIGAAAFLIHMLHQHTIEPV